MGIISHYPGVGPYQRIYGGVGNRENRKKTHTINIRDKERRGQETEEKSISLLYTLCLFK